jgi:hypothetical protein
MCFLVVAQGPLRFELKRIEKKTTRCVVTFEYPEVISAASPQARDRINAGILRVLLRRSDWPAPDSGFRSLEAYANDFLTFCASESRPLYQHKRVMIFRYTPPILSFRFDAHEDAGGVHPFGTTFFVNFESRTGQVIRITDLVREDALPEFESIAEETFRREHDLFPTESLSKWFSFPGDRFRLNDNFGIGEEQLVFLYNTYEIGSGAMPPTKIKLPYSGHLLNLFKIDLRAR